MLLFEWNKKVVFFPFFWMMNGRVVSFKHRIIFIKPKKTISEWVNGFTWMEVTVTVGCSWISNFTSIYLVYLSIVCWIIILLCRIISWIQPTLKFIIYIFYVLSKKCIVHSYFLKFNISIFPLWLFIET